MNDVLTLSGGGSTVVATDELLLEAARIGQCAALCDDWLATIRRFSAQDAGASWLNEANESTLLLQHAESLAQQLAEQCRATRKALLTAMQSYSDAERRLTMLLSVGTPLGAWMLGNSMPLLFGLAALATVSVSGLAVLTSALLRIPVSKLPGVLATHLTSNAGVVNRPEFVRLVRSIVSSTDEFAAGVAHIPVDRALTLGQIFGASNGAAGVMTLARLASTQGNAVLVETPQKVSSAGPMRPVEPPHSVAQLAERVPSSGGGVPQIRVERYGTEIDPKWVVYIAGTGDFSPTPHSDPFDLTSDVQATAGYGAASERSVRSALLAAGASPEDPVLPVGHSQGGLLAARLAASSSLNVVGYVSLGGPVGAVNTGDIPGISIEHAEDLVPALGGIGEAPSGLLTVSRSALDASDVGGAADSSAYRSDQAAPFAAHDLAKYRETAELVSKSQEPRLQRFDQLVRDFTGTDSGTKSLWSAQRVPRTPLA